MWVILRSVYPGVAGHTSPAFVWRPPPSQDGCARSRPCPFFAGRLNCDLSFINFFAEPINVWFLNWDWMILEWEWNSISESVSESPRLGPTELSDRKRRYNYGIDGKTSKINTLHIRSWKGLVRDRDKRPLGWSQVYMQSLWLLWSMHQE